MTYSPNRPSDASIVQALAQHFHVDPCVIVAWLKQVDYKQVTEEIAEGKLS